MYTNIKIRYILGCTGGACYDYDPNCAYWAADGLCINMQYAAYMSNTCQYSCRGGK